MILDIMNEEAPAKNTVWVLWSNWFWSKIWNIKYCHS